MTTKIQENHSQAHLFEQLPVDNHQTRHLCSGRNAPQFAQEIQKKGWAFLKVSGWSMFPWIREGDVVFLRHTKINDISRGDVIVFEKNGILCIHRVLSISGNATESNIDAGLITKGDAALDLDEPVSPAELRGKVEFIYRGSKEIKIARGWRGRLGRFLAFASPTTRWWKPAASLLNRKTARRELLGVPRFEVHRTSEHSAD